MRVEKLIIGKLIQNEEYARKVVPHTKPEYFADSDERVIIEEYLKFFNEYNKLATKEILKIEIANRNDIGDSQFKGLNEYIENMEVEDSDFDWSINTTEAFYRERAINNAIVESIHIIDGKNKTLDSNAIPKILEDALALSFDTNIGHDYLDDWAQRYDFYHQVENKLSFDIEILNKITKGGLNRKTLNVVMSGPGGGKSLFLCHMAASALASGKNVLYITLEMSEERISERIDANLLNLNMDELHAIDKKSYETKIKRVTDKTLGKVIVKEYPTGGAHAGHFRALIEELKAKKNFKPDLLIVDYIGICASSRLKQGSSNTNTYMKSICEELRGLGVVYDFPVLSAVQTTRCAINSSDVDMADTGESIGISQTVDLQLALIGGEELDSLNQVMVKQLKNRYNDLSYYRKFVVGVDKGKMRLYNVENFAQNDIVDAGHKGKPKDDDKPLYDRSKKRDEKKDYGNFKF